jgi:hypothetical protein
MLLRFFPRSIRGGNDGPICLEAVVRRVDGDIGSDVSAPQIAKMTHRSGRGFE